MKTDVRKLTVGGLFLVATFLLMLSIVNAPVMAIANPAAVYCEALGYEYSVESTPQGQRGLCQLPNGEKVSAWQFLKGEVGQEYSYCQQKGYEIKTVKDTKTCTQFGIDRCAVCVLEDGTEVEVTKLMGLDFSSPGYFRVPVVPITVAAVVVVIAVILAVVFLMRRRARLKVG